MQEEIASLCSPLFQRAAAVFLGQPAPQIGRLHVRLSIDLWLVFLGWLARERRKKKGRDNIYYLVLRPFPELWLGAEGRSLFCVRKSQSSRDSAVVLVGSWALGLAVF